MCTRSRAISTAASALEGQRSLLQTSDASRHRCLLCLARLKSALPLCPVDVPLSVAVTRVSRLAAGRASQELERVSHRISRGIALRPCPVPSCPLDRSADPTHDPGRPPPLAGGHETGDIGETAGARCWCRPALSVRLQPHPDPLLPFFSILPCSFGSVSTTQDYLGAFFPSLSRKVVVSGSLT